MESKVRSIVNNFGGGGHYKVSGPELIVLPDEEFDEVLQSLTPQELEETARALQEAINKLQHEYKRLSQVMLFDEAHSSTNSEPVETNQTNGGGFSLSEQKLAKLCVRNRKCLSRLMAVEWEAEKTSESGSSVNSDLSSEDLNNGSENGDSDYSEMDNAISSPTFNQPPPQKFDKRMSRCSTGGDLESICEEGNSNGPFNNGPTMAIDLSTCLDFVQSLGEQVKSMQDKIQKSKECLLDDETDEEEEGEGKERNTSFVDGTESESEQSGMIMTNAKENGSITNTNVSDNNSSNGSAYLHTSGLDMPVELPEPTPAEFEDDGCYETPLQVDALRQRFENRAVLNALHNGPRITQDQEYEEVLRVPHRQPSQNEMHEKNDSNYMTVSNYENHVNHEAQVHNNVQMRVKSKKKSGSTKGGVEDGAIYEFPPDDGEEDSTELDIDEQRKVIKEEEVVTKPVDDIIYKYDGPLIFGIEDTSEIIKLEERDAVRKWDPLPILRELYTNQRLCEQQIQQDGPPQHRTGEISMEGYMEKLPMGETEGPLIKKWKKRYFRAKQGNLFYYEDHKAKKSLGYIHLIGGRVTEISNKVLEVTDMRGRVLLLRCNSKMEFEDWRAVLSAETGLLYCPKTAMITPVSKHVVIIDMGGCSVRAGVLSECDTAYPQVFFPCVVATQGRSKDKNAYGFDALAPDCRNNAKLNFPFRNPNKLEQFKLSMQVMEGLMDSAFSELCVDPIAYTVLLIVPFNLGPKLTEKLTEMVFDRFNVEGLYLQEQALMALYSYKATSGIVVNIGERVDVVPIVDGYIVEKGVYRLPYGGRQITEHLTRLLTETGHRFFSNVEMYISRFLKEKACFVAQDYQAELKFCSLDPELCSTYIDMTKYDIPNGRGGLKLDYSRFRSTEGLFHPEVWGKDHPGLHTLVYSAIQACENDIRKQMCRSIYLCGGTTLLPGMAERLRSELVRMLPKSCPVKVHAAPERYHAAYYGASVLAPLSAFDNMCITKDEWKQLGPTSLTKWQSV
ncbi:uncharacterized protein [Amphiura filiformis]|uniref:uncharacterized protein isoform X2 n=1 Tax=Amphiura filiformis TaxID=82378 RepID=UPI003B228560